VVGSIPTTKMDAGAICRVQLPGGLSNVIQRVIQRTQFPARTSTFGQTVIQVAARTVVRLHLSRFRGTLHGIPAVGQCEGFSVRIKGVTSFAACAFF